MSDRTTSFVSLSGSVGEATRQVREITEFTASTPFQLEGVAIAAKQLITAKGNAEGLQGTLAQLGDISARAAVPIQELASIYAKAMNKGKIQAEELNQLSERGIPIMRVLSEQLGVTKNELFELGAQGALGFDDLVTAFETMTSEGGFAFDAMTRQSETFSGRVSSLKDNVLLAAAAMGETLSEAFNLKDAIENMTSLTAKVGEFFDSLNSNGVDELTSYTELVTKREQLAAILEREVSTTGRMGKLAKQRQAEAAAQLRIINERLGAVSKEEVQLSELERQMQRNTAEIEGINAATEETVRKGRRNVVVTRELTDEERRRIANLNTQNAALSQQSSQLLGVLNTTRQISTAMANMDTSVLAEFSDLKAGLRTSRERIEDEYKEGVGILEKQKKNYLNKGVISPADIQELTSTEARLFAKRKQALADLAAREAPKKKVTPSSTPKTVRSSGDGGGGGGSVSDMGDLEIESESVRIKRETQEKMDKAVKLAVKTAMESASSVTDQALGTEFSNSASEGIISQYATEESIIRARFAEERAIIMEETALTEEARVAILAESRAAEQEALFEANEVAHNATMAFQDSLAQSLEGLIMQTMTWQQALWNIGKTIGTQIVGDIAKMAAKWVRENIIMQGIMKAGSLLSSTLKAKDTATTVASEATKAAAAAPAATLTSISSYGAAAAIGLGAVAAAMLTMKSFNVGGYTGGGDTRKMAGVVEYQEFVNNASSTRVNRPFLEYANGGGNLGELMTASASSGFAQGAGSASYSPAAPPTVIMVDSRPAAEEIAAGIDGPVSIQDIDDRINSQRS